MSLEEGSEPLDAERASTYASCVMLALRVAKYRHEILNTVKELAKGLKAPTAEQWAKLRWLGRFLAGHRRAETFLPAAGALDIIDATTGASRASCSDKDKATSCGALGVGGCVQGLYCRGQDELANGPGEAEFYGCESVVNEALGLQDVDGEFDIHLAVNLQTDSTAAIGMIQRRCMGKICIHLHLQELIRNGKIGSIEMIKTELNVAEIGTKHLGVANMNELLELLMVRFLDGDGEPHPNVGQMAKIAHMLCEVLLLVSQSGVENERKERLRNDGNIQGCSRQCQQDLLHRCEGKCCKWYKHTGRHECRAGVEAVNFVNQLIHMNQQGTGEQESSSPSWERGGGASCSEGMWTP